MITGAVITRNEERHLGDCLASLAWADRLLVLDSGSEDRTRAIAEEAGAYVALRPFTNYAEQRNAALALVSTPWVVFVDADERTPPALAQEIREAIARAEDVVGFWIPRENHIMGRVMRGGGWWPDEQLRVLRVDRARYQSVNGVHEVPVVDGPTARLSHPLVHYNYESWRQFFAKQDRYARQAALDLARRGVTMKPYTLALQPLRAAHRRFVTWHGYRDGVLGAALALAMGWHELTVYWRLVQLTRRRGRATEARV
ncbi:MAG: glycosyltransferase family 2 protein [Dehalococcoidia bacterium]|nr:glycosyltransferase family 2 protein [Dehalococcoidia bacterium]